MVFFAAPVIRTVARMLLPSTRQPMTCARFSALSLFIMTIMLNRLRIVKHQNPRNSLECQPPGHEFGLEKAFGASSGVKAERPGCNPTPRPICPGTLALAGDP